MFGEPFYVEPFRISGTMGFIGEIILYVSDF
jgi:hypothetical protein